jgi:hypothetical protein
LQGPSGSRACWRQVRCVEHRHVREFDEDVATGDDVLRLGQWFARDAVATTAEDVPRATFFSSSVTVAKYTFSPGSDGSRLADTSALTASKTVGDS